MDESLLIEFSGFYYTLQFDIFDYKFLCSIISTLDFTLNIFKYNILLTVHLIYWTFTRFKLAKKIIHSGRVFKKKNCFCKEKLSFL